MSDAGPTTTGGLGQAIQTVWAGSTSRKYPRIATGKTGERHIIKSATEEPHPEDERPSYPDEPQEMTDVLGPRPPSRYRIFRDRRGTRR